MPTESRVLAPAPPRALSEIAPNKRPKKFDAPFVAFDGEGIGNQLVLLADSTGRTLKRKSGLGTEECLEWLLDADPVANNVFFGMGWDVTMILKDIPLRRGPRNGTLYRLYKKGWISWKGYVITYTRNFRLSVRRREHSRRRSASFYDVHGFFQSSFETALRDWRFQVPAIIKEGKAARGSFDSWPMRKLVEYNAAEVELLVLLMDRFRDSLRGTGYRVSTWHGAGAVASFWLQQKKVKAYLGPVPEKIGDLSLFAYFGGRIEISGWGRVDPVYHYDIRSAYPSALAECPDLSKLRWHREQNRGAIPSQPFSLVRVSWRVPHVEDHSVIWGPLPFRRGDGRILFPLVGEGWYWSVEVQAAFRRFGKRLHLKVLDAWIPEGDFDYPLAGELDAAYRERRRRKEAGDPSEYPIKLALNSLYGKLAQRLGFGKEPPYRCYPWAGFITAFTRANLSDAIAAAGERVACVMTDGVWALEPLEGKIPIGEKLGEWEAVTEDVAAEFLQAGVHRVFHSDGSITDYSRGWEYDAGIDFDDILKRWESGEPYSPQYVLRRFVGIALAAMFPNYRPHFGTFIDMKRGLEDVPHSGTTKRLPHILSEPEDPPHFLHPVPIPTRERKLSHPYIPVPDGVTDRDELMLRLAEEALEV